ncbi:MAG: DUF5320 domain-containing protein [Deltaproteobacteria bacterium]|nr:DUF5320 domain-containing protein [Deltaproteobacteria bacterium]MBW2137970.1 DUF5320 domain-containing protein [Deltaproteobacteria bacterium]
MPAFDGTGPLGRGPMTGWGRGYCVTAEPMYSPYPGWPPGYFIPGYGRGFGRGFGRGWGRGRGFCRWIGWGPGFRRRFWPPVGGPWF